MKKYKISKVIFKERNKHGEREIDVVFTDKSVTKITPCYESWQQWNNNREHLSVTCDLADKYNCWLHRKCNL